MMRLKFFTKQADAKSCKGGEKGFSLLELLIAMVIFLIVTASIYGLMQVGRIDRNRASRRSDVLKNARVAIHLIGRDALNAGLSFNTNGAVTPDNFLAARFAVNPDPDTERDTLASVFAGNNLNTNDLTTTPGQKTDIITFAFRDMDFNAGNTIEMSDVIYPPGSPATVRLQTKNAGAAAVARPYDLYLIESDSSQIAIMATATGSNTVDAAPGDPLGLNQALDGVGTAGSLLQKCPPRADTDPVPENCTTYNATLKRFTLVSYRVKQDGTLVRITYGNNRGAGAGNQIVEQPLAYNIEDMQFRYVLNDGRVLENPGAGPDGIYATGDDTPQEYNFIRQVLVSMKVQSPENDEQTGKRQTITLNATFSTRNMEYDAG